MAQRIKKRRRIQMERYCRAEGGPYGFVELAGQPTLPVRGMNVVQFDLPHQRARFLVVNTVNGLTEVEI